MNHYVRSTLGFKTDLQYNLFGPVHPWDSVGETYREDTGGAKLRRAMAQNPYMHVLTQSGAQKTTNDPITRSPNHSMSTTSVVAA